MTILDRHLTVILFCFCNQKSNLFLVAANLFSTDDPGPKKSRMCKTKLKNQEGQLFNVESHSDKQLRHFKFLSVSFMSQLLSSQSFVKKVMMGDGF